MKKVLLWQHSKILYNTYKRFLWCSLRGKQNVSSHASVSSNNNDEKLGQQVLISKIPLQSGPRKKVAMLVAYCGENYHGVMMNRGDRSYPTVEKEFLTAVVKAKLVPNYCWNNPHAMRFVIASRTDKGVSACGQLFSLVLCIRPDTIDLINQHLPDDIKVLGLQRVTSSFSAWRFASWRIYSYTLPTYAFADPSELSEDYRITADKLKHIRSIAYRYKGSHTFHNFTSGIRMGEPQAIRRIMEFDVEKPFIHNSMEFITLRIKGQSFILHQIRMMIGLMISVVSGRAGEEFFIRAFSEKHVDVPLAPGSGLLLEKISYDRYNCSKRSVHGNIDFSAFQEKVNDFYKTKILPVILRKETEEKNMMMFMDALGCHNFSRDQVKEVDITSVEPDCEAFVEFLDNCYAIGKLNHVKSFENNNDKSLLNDKEEYIKECART